MNRYTRLTYNTLNDLPLPQIPFEALGNVMQQYQKQQDVFETLKDAQFNALDEEGDQKLAKEVGQYQDKIVSDLANTYYNTGSTQEYMQAVRSGVKNLMKLRQPGGPIAALEARYNQYQSGMAELKEKYKDDEAQDNYIVAMSRLKSGIGEIEYDYDTGTYNSITVPNVTNFVDVYKEIREMAKDIIPAERQVVRIENGYVYDEYDKKYPITEAMTALMNSPKFKTQTLISAEYKSLQMSEEQKDDFISDINGKKQELIKNAQTAISDLEAKLNSGDKTLVKEAQDFLQRSGFDTGGLDGKVSPKTQAAFDAISNKYAEVVEREGQEVTKDDLISEIAKGIQDNYLKYAGGLVNDSYMQKYKGADWKTQYALKQQQFDKLYNAIITPDEVSFTRGALSATNVSLADDIEELNGSIREAELSIIDKMIPVYDNGVFNRDKHDLNQVTSMYDFFLRNSGSDKLKENYMKTFGVTEDQFNKQVEFFRSNNEALVEIKTRADLVRQKNDSETFMENLINNYIENPGIRNSDISQLARAFNDIVSPIGSQTNNFNLERKYGVRIENGYVVIKTDKGNFVNTGITQKELSEMYSWNMISPNDIREFIKDKKNVQLTHHLIKNTVPKDVFKSLEKESVNYYMESEVFDDDNMIKSFTKIIKYSGEGTMLDSITGKQIEWVDNEGTVAENINESSIQVRPGVVNGRPVLVAMANDNKGITYQKVIDVSKLDDSGNRFSSSIKTIAMDLYAANRIEDSKSLMPFISPVSATEALVIENTFAKDSNTQDNFIFEDEMGKNVFSGKYKELRSIDLMNDKTGVPVKYAVIALEGPSKNKDKYYLVNMNTKTILNENPMGYPSANTAIMELNWIGFEKSMPTDYVPSGSLKKGTTSTTAGMVDRELATNQKARILMEGFNAIYGSDDNPLAYNQ